jgi:hypothetical protein
LIIHDFLTTGTKKPSKKLMIWCNMSAVVVSVSNRISNL